MRSADPKMALSETVELSKTLTAVREAVGVEGGQEAERSPQIHVGPQRARWAWEEERRRCPLFFHHPIIIGGGGGVSVDGGEGLRRLDELDKLVVVADDPLRSMRARECGPKSERLPVPV